MRKNPTDWNANDPGRNWHLDVFFGLHYDLHAGVGDTELGAALTPEHLREELEKVQPDWVQCDCKGHPGYTSWPTEVGSTSPGVVKDALRIHRDVTRAMGLPLVMHYSGVWDNRAIELHPDWACAGPSGEVAGKEGFVTGATCNLSAYTDELMTPQLLELVEKYDVDGFWVDGENWATRACYCPRCTAAFTTETGLSDIPQAPTEPGWAEWAAFHRRIFEAHVSKYADAVHARKPSCTICSNWMYTVGQPDAINVPIDYQSGDFSWVWSTGDALLEGRFMDSRGLSWDLMAWGFTTGEPNMGGWTFKTAPMLCQEAACVIALAGAFSIYNNPQRNGHLTGWQQDIMAEAGRFIRARQPWCQYTETVPQIAVLHSQSHFHAHTEEVLMSKWKGIHGPVVGALHALLENGCSVDILNDDALLERMHEYKLVVIPEQTHLPQALKDALADYVRNGGKLILSGVEVTENFAELAGAQSAGEPQDEFFYLQVGSEATTVKGPRRPVTLAGAEAFRCLMTEQEPAFNTTDQPVITLNHIGAGTVAAIHAPLFKHFADTHYPRTRALVGEIVVALKPGLMAELDAPARVQLVLRRKENLLIAHLVNLGATHPTSPTQVMIEDVPPVGPITLRLQLAASPKSVYLAPSKEGLEWDWHDGTLTARIASVGIMDSLIVEE